MSNLFKKLYRERHRTHHSHGFVLPFTLLISSIMILISISISTTLAKQLYFSRLARQSQLAYYAADNAVQCAVMIDDTYIGSSGGIFPFDQATQPSPGTYVQDAFSDYKGTHPNVASIFEYNLKCAQSYIFVPNIPPNPNSTDLTFAAFSHNSEDGWTTTFNMKMDLGGNIYRCAKVTVNKTSSYRQVIAQGYSSCDTTFGRVERAVINATDFSGE